MCSLPKYFLHTREQNYDDTDVLRCLRTNTKDATTRKSTKIQKLEQGNIVKDIPASGLNLIVSFIFFFNIQFRILHKNVYFMQTFFSKDIPDQKYFCRFSQNKRKLWSKMIFWTSFCPPKYCVNILSYKIYLHKCF